jgi:hypothetical protein
MPFTAPKRRANGHWSMASPTRGDKISAPLGDDAPLPEARQEACTELFSALDYRCQGRIADSEIGAARTMQYCGCS